MSVWSFCRKCGWHSTGKFSACPRCNSKMVHHFDNDLLPNAKGNLFSLKKKKEHGNSPGAAKEKDKRE